MIIIIYPKLTSNLSIDLQSLEIFSMDPRALHRITGSQFFLLLSIFLNLTLAKVRVSFLAAGFQQANRRGSVDKVEEISRKGPGRDPGWMGFNARDLLLLAWCDFMLMV